MMEHDEAGESPAQPFEKDETVVPVKPPPAAKHPDLFEILEPMRSLGLKELADERVVAILLQNLGEKIDRIHILEAEIERLGSEKADLRVACAKQEVQLGSARKSHMIFGGISALGGLLIGASSKAPIDSLLAVALLVTGIVLIVVGAIGART